MENGIKAKMKLHLQNFRCYLDTEITLSAGITLVKGASGVGKSTIANAIDYVLYGKVQKPYAHGTKQCRVTLTLPNKTTISRQSGPGKLTLEHDGKKYEQDTAQAIIDQLFGAREIFLASSYGRQGGKCALMEGTNAEKLELIHSISFRDDKATAVQARLKAASKVEDATCSERKLTRDAAKMALKSFDTANPKVVSSRLSTNDFDQDALKAQIETSFKKLSDLRSQLAEIAKLEGHISALIAFTREGDDGDDKALQAENDKLEQELKMKRDEEEQLIKLVAGSAASVRMDELREAKQKELSEVNEQLDQVYEVLETRDASAIQTEFARLESNQVKLNEIGKLLTAAKLSDRNDMRDTITNISGKLREARQKLNDLEESLTAIKWNAEQELNLQCPKCSAALRMQDGSLCLHGDNFVRDIKTVNIKGVTEAMVRDAHTAIAQLESRREEVSRCQGDVAKILRDMTKEKPRDAEKLQACLKLSDLQKRMTTLNAELSKLGDGKGVQVGSEESELNIKRLKQEQEILRQTISNNGLKIASIRSSTAKKAELEDLQRKLGNRDSKTLRTEIDELDAETRNTKSMIETFNAVKTREMLCQSITEAEEQLDVVMQRSSKIAKLREIAKIVERQVLEQTVAILNIEMEKFLNIMFSEHPIRVEFSMTKQLKTQSKTSDQCSLRIFHKNCEYDDVKQLSGGEADRVSLAMMLALNHICGSSIVILDETLSTLDSTLKITIIEMLREFCGSTKFAMIISHEGVEGAYSNVIDLDRQ